MSGPKHLWSGDWEADSSASREERRRRRPVEEARPEPPAPAPAVARGPSLWVRFGAGVRALVGAARSTQVGVVAIVVAVLLTAAAGYGLTSLIAGANTSSPAHGPRAWLGVSVTGTPAGIVIANVDPGSPAALSGLQPGDAITEIGNQPIGTVDAVSAALSGLRPGQTVPITFTRGVVPYRTDVTLTNAPSGGP